MGIQNSFSSLFEIIFFKLKNRSMFLNSPGNPLQLVFIYICMCSCMYILPGQTASLIWLKLFKGTLGGIKGKKIDFSSKFGFEKKFGLFSSTGNTGDSS